MSDQVVIREMIPSDAQAASELSAELGYPLSVGVIEARLQHLATLKHSVVYAACWHDQVVGWIDVGIVHHLVSGSYGEIGGLIVSSQYQRLGIGRKLVETAEQWIVCQQVTTLLVRSRITREQAHNFYLGQNFSKVKTSAVFTKSLLAL